MKNGLLSGMLYGFFLIKLFLRVYLLTVCPLTSHKGAVSNFPIIFEDTCKPPVNSYMQVFFRLHQL